jgi:hypothetical protein
MHGDRSIRNRSAIFIQDHHHGTDTSRGNPHLYPGNPQAVELAGITPTVGISLAFGVVINRGSDGQVGVVVAIHIPG